jgi:hypothetical protein
MAPYFSVLLQKWYRVFPFYSNLLFQYNNKYSARTHSSVLIWTESAVDLQILSNPCGGLILRFEELSSHLHVITKIQES